MTFQNLVPDLAKRLAIPPPKPDARQLTLVFDGKWNVTCEHDESADEMLFFLPLPAFRRENAHLLERDGVFGAGLAGFAVSYVDEFDACAIWRRYRNEFLDADEVEDILSRLVDVASALQSRLEAEGEESSAWSGSGEPSAAEDPGPGSRFWV